MAHFSSFPGASALSDFRQKRLLHTLQSIDPNISDVGAAYVHFVSCGQAPGADEIERLAALLRYGAPVDANAAPARATGVTLLAIPRLGTVSPWASKATDI